MKDLCSKNYARKSLICPNVAILRKDSGGVADPDPVPFWPLDPGSGIGLFRIPDLRSQPHIFQGSITFFGVKFQLFFVNWPKVFSLLAQK
jgi:hypothetical protein